MDDEDSPVGRLARFAEDAFALAARRSPLNAGDTFTVPIQIPEESDSASVHEVLGRLADRGYATSHTTGTGSITITRINMPDVRPVSGSTSVAVTGTATAVVAATVTAVGSATHPPAEDLLGDIRTLLGQAVQLQMEILHHMVQPPTEQQKPFLTKGEIISLIALLWAVTYGVTTLLGK